MLKKVGIVFACLLLTFVVAAVTLPMIINVDNYRPEIEAAVNEQINGELKLGKLNLSLWGGVKVKIESISVTVKGEDKPLLTTDSAYVEIPFLSLLSGSARLTAVLEKPGVRMIRYKNGKINAMMLMPETPAEKKSGKESADREAVKDKASTKSASNRKPNADSPEVPAFVANAALGIRIVKGDVLFTDKLAEGGKYSINGVELDVQNLGLKETIEITLIMPVEGKSNTLALNGTLRMQGNVTPVMSGSEVRSASGDLRVDMTDLALTAGGGAFQKTNSMPLRFDMKFQGSETDLQIQKMKIEAHKLVLNGSGVLTLKPAMATKFQIQSTDLDLASFEEMVPMLKAYSLKGAAITKINIEGPTEKLKIQGSLNVKKGSVSYPEMLQAPVAFAIDTGFTEDSFTLLGMTANGPETDMKLSGNVRNFKAPRFDFKLASKNINLDKLLKKSEKSADLNSTSSMHKWANRIVDSVIPYAQAKKASADKNPMLEAAKNPVVAKAQGQFVAKIDQLITAGAPITDIQATVKLKDMDLTVPSASLKTFGGSVNASAAAKLASVGLDYSTKGKVSGISAQNALTTYFPTYKNTLTGTVGANWNLSGKSFPEAARLPSIKGTMELEAADGSFKTADVQDSIVQIMSKIPFLKQKKAPKLDEGFKTLYAKLSFNNGTISADPLKILQRGRGFDLRGRSVIDPNLNQDTYIDVFDPNQLLPKEISDGKTAALQLHIKGSLMDPKTDYGYTISRVGKKVVKSQGKDLVKKGLGKLLGGGSKDSGGGGKSAGDALKDKLKKKFKLF